MRKIDHEYLRTHGHAQPHSHREELAENAGKGVRHVCAQG